MAAENALRVEKKYEKTRKDRLLTKNHLYEWVKTHAQVERELSDAHDLFCECGHLATRAHESGCRKLRNKIMSETIKRLSHLLPKENVRLDGDG